MKITPYLQRIYTTIRTYLQRHPTLEAFFTYFSLGMLFYAIKSIPNALTLPMNGDYILQQLHFYVEGYDKWWHFFTTGEFPFWSYENFIGVNYYAANTFYYLTSPFMFPMLLVPRTWMPQMIFIMMIVKFSTGALLFRYLMKRYFNVSDRAAFIGGLAYGFGGWGVFYLWFNHFSDVLALAPLIFIGIEHAIKHRKGWLLTLGVVALGLANYFYLYTFAITGAVYGAFRFFMVYRYKSGYTWWEGVQAAGAAILGFGLGILIISVVLYPTYLLIVDTPRMANSNLLLDFFRFFFSNPEKTELGYQLGELKSWTDFTIKENVDALVDFMFKWDPKNANSTAIITPMQSMLYPLAQFLFPTSSNWDSLLFKNPTFDNTISSLFITTPLGLLVWVAIMKTIGHKRPLPILAIIILLVIPFIPFTYYLLHFFTVDYGRWQLFLIIVMLIATVPLLDHLLEIPKWQIDIAFAIHLLLSIGVTYYAISINRLDMEWRVFIVAAQFLYLIALYVYLRFYAKGEGVLENVSLAVTVELFAAIVITLNSHGVSNYATLYGGQNLLREQQQLVNQIQASDDGFYRIFNQAADRGQPNLQMTLGYNGLSTFHSVYSFNLFDFINNWSKVSYSYSNWSMGIHEKRYNLDAFLGVKYYILPKADTNIPLGFELFLESEHYSVYRNTNHIELGFAFDKLVPLNNFSYAKRTYEYESGYLQAAIIKNDDMDEVVAALGDNPLVVNNTSNTYINAPFPQWSFHIRGESEPTPVGSFAGIQQLFPQERQFTNSYGNTDFNFYGRWIEQGYAGDKIILNYSSSICSNTTEEGCNVIVNFLFGPNALVSLYHNDTLITEDSHMVHYYGKDGDHKYARGFYVDEPFNKVVIEFINDAPYSLVNRQSIGVAYEYYSTYKSRLDLLALNSFSNISHTGNSLSFDTNYDDPKMLVLQVPYDKGWSLKINNEPAKIYEVTGGFIGIVAPQGAMSYSLEYVSPGVAESAPISLIGLLLFALFTAFVERKTLYRWGQQLLQTK